MSSTGSEKIAELEAQGWTDVPFFLSEANRADFARLANVVIDIACEDEAVRESLHITLSAPPEAQQRTGTFGLIHPRNSSDEKIALHIGYQSRERAQAMLGANQPQVMDDFWEASGMVLDEIAKSSKSALRRLGAEAVVGSILPTKPQRRNVHLRTVRYAGALDMPVGTEVVSGHADVGLASLHIYETHGGWIQGAPYTPEVITETNLETRRTAVQLMRQDMRQVVTHPHTAPFFLGANWHSASLVPEGLRDLPALYHAGFVPEPGTQVISPFAERVVGGTHNRVSVVAFLHPNSVALAKGAYVPAPVSYCRPEY